MAEISQPTIEESRRFNFFTSIWIVPFIALIISLWLVYQHFAKLGPEIKIVFANSGGLEAGQSVIKYRDVPVGKVTRIEIEEEGHGVVVIARLNKEVENKVNETTHFWVVKPEVGYGGISGLDTLISGSYIAMQASDGKEKKREFKGLDSPYRDINSGEYILMHSKSVGGVKVGTPINYRNIQVGEVEHISLAQDNKSIEIVVFIKKRYANLINNTTKFWVQGLMDIGFKRGRLDIKMAPLIPYFVFGGITFESKLDLSYPKVPSNYFYTLYESASSAKSRKLGKTIPEDRRFSFTFQGKISGIDTGASIQYQGFDIGEIDKVKMHYNNQTHQMEGLLEGKIDVSVFEDANHTGWENLKKAVSEGMRAKLHSVNPLIDALFVNLVFEKNASLAVLSGKEGEAVLFPVSNKQEASMIAGLTTFSNKLGHLELQSFLDNLNKTMLSFKDVADKSSEPLAEMLKSITKSAESLNGVISDDATKAMPEKLNRAIEELDKTLKTTKRVLRGYRSDSLFGKRLTEMLKEINKNAEESKRLLRKLNKKPNALILGD